MGQRDGTENGGQRIRFPNKEREKKLRLLKQTKKIGRGREKHK